MHVKYVKMGKIRKIYDAVKWPVVYTGAFSSLAGLGSALGVSSASLEERAGLFGEGFIDMLPVSAIINTFYAGTIDLIKKTKHPKIYSNLFCTAVSAAIYLSLRLQGSDNPEATIALPTTLAFILTNIQNRTNNKTLSQ